MRLTMLLALALMLASVAAFANGAAPVEQPAPVIEEEAMPPAGAGPMEEPIEPEVAPMPEPAPVPEAIPPAGAGPGEIPPTMGVPPMMTTQMITPEVETFNTNFIAMNFGVDRSAIISLRQAGWMWGDIYLMAHISSRANRPILEVATLRSQGMTWTDIGSRYNISAAALTTPVVVQTRVAGFVTEYGYQPIYYRTDPWGNPVLTRYEAERLTRLGYSWQNIAIAANVAAETGASVRDVLSWIDRGYTWQQVAIQYGVNQDRIMDVSRYPFGREPGEFVTTTTVQPVPPVGAGPTMQPVPPPMQQPVPVY